MKLRIIDGTTVTKCLTMAECIDLMEATMVSVTRGEASMPQRSFVRLPSENIFGVMPGVSAVPGAFGAKLISIFPGNPALGRPAIQGGICLFGLESGAAVALVEAASVTAVRTAAASAMATRALARDDASILALLGYGVQARSHLEAMLAVRPITEVRVWGRSLAKAQAFVGASLGNEAVTMRAVSTAQAAVEGADLVCAVTAAPEPVLRGSWLTDGCHVNLVGAHSADTREADTAAVQRSRFFVEVRKFALAEAGDILIPIKEGAVGEEHIVGEIGEVLSGERAGRRKREDITMYKNLGNVAQDLAAARAIYERACERGLGATIGF